MSALFDAVCPNAWHIVGTLKLRAGYQLPLLPMGREVTPLSLLGSHCHSDLVAIQP